MRDILFRGKRADNPGWVEGLVACGYDYDDEAPVTVIIPNDAFFDVGYKTDGWDFVIPETVGQWSGLDDKNGKRIFEGDILESRASENEVDWKRWRVLFEDGGFCFERIAEKPKRNKRSNPEKYLLCEDEINLYGLVIIGNIHDNPELLIKEA